MRPFAARDTAALAVGSTVSGLLAYVFFSIVTRALGATLAAPVSVLWTYWAAAAAVLTFPLQHWIARSVAAEGGEAAVRSALPNISRVVAVAAVLAAGLAWGARGALFARADMLFPFLVGAVTVGSGFVGVVRGVLTARRRFGAVGFALVGENGVRCLAALVLVVAGVRTSAAAYGAALALGPLIGLLWPSALRFGRGRAGDARRPASALAFLGGVAGGSLLGQFVLTGGPVVLALVGGRPAAVTALFAGLALFRAPYTMALGVVAQVTGWLTGLVVTGQAGPLARVRLLILSATAVGSAVSAALGFAAGPWMVRGVFGADVVLASSAAAVIAGASAFALGNLLMTLTLVARGRGGGVLRAWLLATISGGVTVALVSTNALDRVVYAFAVAEVAAFVVMLIEDIAGARKPAPAPPPTALAGPPVA